MPDFLDLKPGHRVRVRGGGSRSSHDSSIVEIANDSLLIEPPHENGVKARLRAGDTLEVVLQANGRNYAFRTAIRRFVSAPTPAVEIEMPQTIAHHERREFYRLPVSIKPRYAALTNDADEELERVEVVISDISGGGCRMRTTRWVPVGSWFRLIFALTDDPEEVDLVAEALSISEDGRRGTYRINARFRELQRSVEERLVRYVFSQQVELLQKGLL